MIYIYKDINGTFYFQVLIEDVKSGKIKKYKKRGFNSETEARKAALRFTVNERNKDDSNFAFDTIISEYLNFKKQRISDRSLQKAERIINLYILPFVSGKNMKHYSALEAENFYNKILSFKHAPDYMNAIISQFKVLFKFAHDYYGLDNNPVLRLEYRKHVVKAIEVQSVYNVDEFNQYISVFSEENPYEISFKLFFTVLFFTGLRRGECKALRWNDIDFDNAMLNVDEQAIDKDRNHRVLISKVLKNPQSYRKVPLNSRIIQLLKKLKDQRILLDNYDKDDFIFQRKGLSKLPLADSTIYNRNVEASRKSNQKYINIHGFRHSYASNLLSYGAPLTAVSESLGHSSISVTEKVYTHAINRDRELLKKALNILGDN